MSDDKDLLTIAYMSGQVDSKIKIRELEHKVEGLEKFKLRVSDAFENLEWNDNDNVDNIWNAIYEGAET